MDAVDIDRSAGDGDDLAVIDCGEMLGSGTTDDSGGSENDDSHASDSSYGQVDGSAELGVEQQTGPSHDSLKNVGLSSSTV